MYGLGGEGSRFRLKFLGRRVPFSHALAAADPHSVPGPAHEDPASAYSLTVNLLVTPRLLNWPHLGCLRVYLKVHGTC